VKFEGFGRRINWNGSGVKLKKIGRQNNLNGSR
jgi:hypothetical protein